MLEYASARFYVESLCAEGDSGEYDDEGAMCEGEGGVGDANVDVVVSGSIPGSVSCVA